MAMTEIQAHGSQQQLRCVLYSMAFGVTTIPYQGGF